MRPVPAFELLLASGAALGGVVLLEYVVAFSTAYTRDDLLVLAKLADWAFSWIATEGRNAE